ncbi:hypothetical protein [Novosphingobium sp.]|uniref:hypothetical protein n=1 Tax=Novosphingobium sp. TaxID=1874826 RepID=UPI003D6C8A51
MNTDKERLTEAEVLAAARSIRELEVLRQLQENTVLPARITIKGSIAGIDSIPLEQDEFQAVVALLIERHTTMIASLNIEPKVPVL